MKKITYTKSVRGSDATDKKDIKPSEPSSSELRGLDVPLPSTRSYDSEPPGLVCDARTAGGMLASSRASPDLTDHSSQENLSSSSVSISVGESKHACWHLAMSAHICTIPLF